MAHHCKLRICSPHPFTFLMDCSPKSVHTYSIVYSSFRSFYCYTEKMEAIKRSFLILTPSSSPSSAYLCLSSAFPLQTHQVPQTESKPTLPLVLCPHPHSPSCMLYLATLKSYLTSILSAFLI